MTQPVTRVLKYTGPAQQVCYELSQYGFSPLLRTDTAYEVPVDFAEALLNSNAHFVLAESYSLGESHFSESAQPETVVAEPPKLENQNGWRTRFRAADPEQQNEGE